MISIIIPVYNVEAYLERCVESVVHQTYANIEILLVDDGSTDGSGSLCDEWERKDCRVRVFHKANGGVSSARNLGLKYALGDYVLMLDSDDALDRNACQVLCDLQREKSADCIVFGIRQDNGNIWAPQKHADYNTSFSFRQDYLYWLNTELLSPPWNKLYKRVLINEGFPETVSFGEDLVFSLSYLKECERITFVPTPLYLHNNLNVASVTHRFDRKRIYDIEQWQSAVLHFDKDARSDEAQLFFKYLKDVLFYLKGLYRSEDISNSERKEFLKQWYQSSHLSKVNVSYQGSRLDRMVLACVKGEHWDMLQMLFDCNKWTKKVWKR